MSYGPQTKAWLVLGSVLIICLLLNIDYSAANLVLVDISRDFEADLNVLQWVLSGYTLAWGAIAIIGGRLSDLYGKRRLFFIGVFLFGLSSTLCGVAWATWVIILGRVLQGVAGGLFISPLYAIVFMAFPPNKRGLAIGMIGVAAGIGLAFGPSMAGAVLEFANWRWVFYVNAPLCALSMAVLALFTDKDVIDDTKETIDYQGAALLSIGLVALLYTLNQAEVWGMMSPLFLSSLGACGLIFVGYAYHQKGHHNRLIPAGFFKNIPYLGCLTSYSMYAFVFSSSLLVANLYLQNVLKYNAYDSGLIFFAMTLSLGALSPFGGKLADIMDPRLPICIGLAMVGLASAWFASFTSETALLQILCSLFLIGTGMGLAFPALNAVMLKTVDPKLLNTASGVFAVGTTVSISLGVIVSSSLLTGLGQHFLVPLLPAELSMADKTSLLNFMASVHQDQADLARFSNPEVIAGVVKRAFTHAMRYTMLLAALISSVAAYIALRTIKGLGENTGSPAVHLAA